jgi:AcrR family transcriptional regulator
MRPQRERLIEKATEEFLAHGYAGANVDRIASAARMSKKTVYQIVATKLELFGQVVADRLARLSPPKSLLSIDDSEPRAALRASLILLADVALSPSGLAAHRLVMREGYVSPELIEANDKPLKPFVESLIAWLTNQVERGWLDLPSPEAAARMLLDMILTDERRNAILGLAPPPEAEARAQRVDEALDLFLKGAIRRG